MMKHRLFAAVVLVLLNTACLMAQKVTIDGITYKLNKEKTEAIVNSGNTKFEEMTILSSVSISGREYPVTAIRKRAFESLSDKMKKVSIPNSVKSIGEYAFLCWNLEELIVPDSAISIDRDAFKFCHAIKTVKCQNGSFPSYIVGYIPEEAPWYISLKYNQQPDFQQEQNSPQSNLAIQNSNPDTSNKKPSSDVDINLPSNAQSNENTFAVIFANENYYEEVKVDYALNDGEMFKTYCQKVLGLPEDNVHIRKDATRNNMIAELAWLQKVAEAYKGQARFIVYYAGHGIPDEKTGISYLLPVDGKGNMLETSYSLKDFYTLLGAMPSAGVTVFMDACFSGSKRGDGMLASARGVAIKAKPQAPQGNMVVFSASQEDETAYPFKEKEHGLFTYFLLKKLKETNGNVTLGDLGAYITEQVSRKSIVANGKSQTPSVVSAGTVGESWKTMKLK